MLCLITGGPNDEMTQGQTRVTLEWLRFKKSISLYMNIFKAINSVISYI